MQPQILIVKLSIAVLSQPFVFVNDDGIARKTKVDVGLSDDEYQELTSIVDNDIEIVIGPNQELRHLLDGDRLNTNLVEDD